MFSVQNLSETMHRTQTDNALSCVISSLGASNMSASHSLADFNATHMYADHNNNHTAATPSPTQPVMPPVGGSQIQPNPFSGMILPSYSMGVALPSVTYRGPPPATGDVFLPSGGNPGQLPWQPRSCALVNNNPNHILMVFVHNPIYPVTTSTLALVVAGRARLVRVVIMRQKTVDLLEAMMEFESVSEAIAVKASLNGADIYTGCCTLEVHFAYERVFKLRVSKNDADTWDFTLGDINSNPLGDINSNPRGLKRKHEGDPLVEEYRGQAQTSGAQPRVLAVFDLNLDQMSPTRLFNLFCMYGDVLKVRFTRAKGDMALVEMATAEGAVNVIEHVNRSVVFGRMIKICHSIQTTVLEPKVRHDQTMPNGFSYFRDFANSAKHRFGHRHSAKLNLIVPPSKLLHVFHLPLEYDTIEKVVDIFTSLNAPKPTQVRLLHLKERQHSRSGFIEFNTLENAIDALCLCNHALLNHNADDKERPSPIFKLCFSVKHAIARSNRVN